MKPLTSEQQLLFDAWKQASRARDQTAYAHSQARKAYLQALVSYDRTREPYHQAGKVFDQAWMASKLALETFWRADKACIDAGFNPLGYTK